MTTTPECEILRALDAAVASGDRRRKETLVARSETSRLSPYVGPEDATPSGLLFLPIKSSRKRAIGNAPCLRLKHVAAHENPTANKAGPMPLFGSWLAAMNCVNVSLRLSAGLQVCRKVHPSAESSSHTNFDKASVTRNWVTFATDLEPYEFAVRDSHMKQSQYYQKLKDPRWQKLRLLKFQEVGFKCESCGSTTDSLNVHHRYYRKGAEPWEYQLNELRSFCESCHKEMTKALKHLGVVMGKHSNPQAVYLIAVKLGELQDAIGDPTGEAPAALIESWTDFIKRKLKPQPNAPLANTAPGQREMI